MDTFRKIALDAAIQINISATHTAVQGGSKITTETILADAKKIYDWLLDG